MFGVKKTRDVGFYPLSRTAALNHSAIFPEVGRVTLSPQSFYFYGNKTAYYEGSNQY